MIQSLDDDNVEDSDILWCLKNSILDEEFCKGNNTHDTENRNVFGIFFEKKQKSFEKGIDKVITMCYNIYRKREKNPEERGNKK